MMSRTASYTCALLIVGSFLPSFVAAYSYTNDWDYYDGSIHHSFNAYDSYNRYDNYYPYSEYWYPYNTSGYYYYNDGYQYTYKPNCSITVSSSNGVGYNRTITLAWSSSYATSAYLSGVGSVGTNGAHAVYYPYASFYTLTVYGPGGASSCSTNTPHHGVQYEYDAYQHPVSYVYPPSTYTYPNYNYVSLAQIPYTGFDFGPFGNAAYWCAIILLAAAGAYLIVYSHTALRPRAFAREVRAAARNQLRHLRQLIR